MDKYFDSYAELGLQRFMVFDRVRTDAFAAALDEVLKGGETVIDAGTGTGLLAMLAARGGAKRVYALEQSSVVDFARELVEGNRLSDTVEIIAANARDFQSMDGADLIVSEWLGHFAFVESMLDDVIVSREANLKEGGRMMPSAVSLFLAPARPDLLWNEEGPGSWRTSVHGLDFSVLEEAEARQGYATKTLVPKEELIGPGTRLYEVDLATVEMDGWYRSGEYTWTPEKDGLMAGFAGWFEAELSPSVTLDTGPESLPTHWRQSYFPMTPRPVKAGQAMRVRYRLERHPREPRALQVRLEVDGEEWIYTVD